MNITKILFVATALVLAAACAEELDEAPTAEISFFHASQTLGAIDIDLGSASVRVEPGQLSAAAQLEPGPVRIDLRNAGAQLPLLSIDETVDLGSNLFVVAGSSTDGSLAAFEVGANAPDPLDGNCAFQVVSATSVDVEFDVYARLGGQPAAIGQYAQTGFFQAPPDAAEILVYNAGDDPLRSAALIQLDGRSLEFRTGAAYAVLITGDLRGIDAIVAPLR